MSFWVLSATRTNYSDPGHQGLGSDPTWYPQFELSNNLTDDIVVVPASDTVVHSGFFCFEVPSDGFYSVRFTWLNDKAWPEGGPDPILDANIKIVRVFFEEEICIAEVDIDIKPGSYPNSINPNAGGVIPVAILTTDDFDARTVNPETVALEGVLAKEKGKSGKYGSLEDVDRDGDLDLVVQIPNTINWASDATEATLTGETWDGIPIEGTDSVRIVPPEQ